MNLFSDNIEVRDLDSAINLFKESREAFVKLFDNSPVCMSMTTSTLSSRTYVRVNKKFLEKFGYDVSEIIGRTSIEIGILDEQESNRVKTIISEKGRLQNDYVKCISKDGKIVHTVSSIEFMDMGGERLLVSFFVDITKVIEQQSIIEKHAQQLEAVNRELESFSYSVSHDLRAPLRAIDGYTRMLEEDFYTLFDEDGRQLLSAVQRNAKKMGILIDNLLEFAKLGKRDIHKANIDMNILVNEVISDLKHFNSHTADIRIGNLHPAKGDYSLIKQVMMNLISNGIKYSSKKENATIEIESHISGNEIVYAVRDNGAGFDMRYADKLFGVFQRLHKSSDFEGTGVGLAIVQRIINKHGGSVSAEAKPDKGATFMIRIPG